MLCTRMHAQCAFLCKKIVKKGGFEWSGGRGSSDRPNLGKPSSPQSHTHSQAERERCVCNLLRGKKMGNCIALEMAYY